MIIIGVAVAIPEPWAEELRSYREELGDETAGTVPSHITLVPPTEIAEERLGEVESHLAAAAATRSPFWVHLRGTGTFRPVSPVVFVALSAGISACEQLAAAVRSGPLEAELSFPYHPHVTVAHDLGEAQLDKAYEELADFECSFDVTAFHLYVHDDRVGWRPTRDFELQEG